MSSVVQVDIRLGHNALLRKKPTLEGFTHDWKVFVRGPDGANIQNFVEKVVFYLHESFPKPKRVVKDPPYEVSESGYAGFSLPIEVHFKSRSEPRKITFHYDLFLQLENSPPVHHMRCEKITFKNPLPDFRQKLLSSGGVIGSNGNDHSGDAFKTGKQPSSEAAAAEISKPPPPKPPPVVSKEFTDLFGAPIIKPDMSLTTKKAASKPTSYASSSSSSSKDKKEKTSSSSSSSKGGSSHTSGTSSPAPSKDRHSSSSRDKHDKHKHSKDKDKSTSKRSGQLSSEELFAKKKRSSSSDKSPTESQSKDKGKENKSSVKPRDVSSSSNSRHSSHKHKSSKKEKHGDSKKDATSDSRSKHHKHDKEKKYSKEKHSADKEAKKDRDSKSGKTSDKIVKKPSPEPKKPPPPFADVVSTGEASDVDPFSYSDDDSKTSPEIVSTKKSTPQGRQSSLDKAERMSISDCEVLTPLEDRSPPNIFSQHSRSSPRKSPANASDRATPTSQLSGGGSRKGSPASHKSHSSSKSTKSKRPEKESGAAASKKAKKEQNSSGSSARRLEQPAVSVLPTTEAVNTWQKHDKSDVHERADRQSGVDKENSGFPGVTSDVEKEPASNGESLVVLVELQQRLMTASDNSLLCRVVELIKETGRYNIDDNMFNFDLCSLDKHTVQKLQTCLLAL